MKILDEMIIWTPGDKLLPVAGSNMR